MPLPTPPSPNPLEFLNLIPCAYPEAFVQRGYGKRKEIKQLASKVFAFNRALCSCFPSKVQTWWPKVCKRLTQVFCFGLWLNVSDLHNDKNHWTSQGNLLVKNYRDGTEACPERWRTPESSCSPQTRTGKSFPNSHIKFSANSVKELNI